MSVTDVRKDMDALTLTIISEYDAPEGDRHWGWWRITSSDAPAALVFVDGFGDGSGSPDPDMPTTTRVSPACERRGARRLTRSMSWAR